MYNIEDIIRPNIKALKPYSSARDEFKGEAKIWLDANESPYESQVNRYPDPHHTALKEVISEMKDVSPDQLFIGNGSDEAIDLLFRAFCEPKVDKAYTFAPTYGMYDVSAQINNIELVKLPLGDDFQLPSIETILSSIDSKGLLFICSPNNPTGNVFPLAQIQEIASRFLGLVVVDEAYVDFSDVEGASTLLDACPNLVILQTLSKAYGMAGLRLGIVIASPEIIQVLHKIKAPYNVNTLSQIKGIELLENRELIQQQIDELKTERNKLAKDLQQLDIVTKVYPSQANFILAVFSNAEEIFQNLREQGIIIRNRTSQIPGGLRISIGTPLQNQTLIKTLRNI